MRKIINIINKAIKKTFLIKYLFSDVGYLHEIGWVNSFINNKVVNKEGEPIPWVTYPYIDFIEKRLNCQMDIFEFGSGNSTYYYAKKVNTITSVEHDKNWFNKISHSMPNNSKLIYEELEYGSTYCQMSKRQNKKFDMVIIDGRDRVNCIKNSIDSLSENGVIVLDDSERKEYVVGYDYLIDNGFKVIDFWGISPCIFYKKCTSIFYKNNNCLCI